MRVLVSFDGSAASGRAALFVMRFAVALRGEVVLLDVSHGRDVSGHARQLEILTDRMGELGVRPTVKSAEGDPGPALAREIRSGDYDLVVFNGRTSAGHLRMGTPASRVAGQLSVSVLIARRTPPELNRILVCTGGDQPQGVESFTTAAELAAAAGASVEVLHVMSQLPVTPEVAVDDTRLARSADWHRRQPTAEGRHLNELVELFTERGVEATARIRYGLVIDEIVEEATSYLADLVVLGAHEGPGFLQFLLDDITKELIETLNQPVLVVRRVVHGDDDG